jgi:hypothetical protein
VHWGKIRRSAWSEIAELLINTNEQTAYEPHACKRQPKDSAMNAQETQAAYRQKIEAELALVQAQLAEYKTQPRSLTAEDRAKHVHRMEALEQRFAEAKAQWRQALDGADEDVWNQMKHRAEGVWKGLQDEIQKTIAEV